MHLSRTALAALALLAADLIGAAHGQSLAISDRLAQAKAQGRAPLEFAVATIKPADPKTQSGWMMPHPGGQVYEVGGGSLKMIIRVTYRITDKQIEGGPGVCLK
jgi:hypothetical protein